MKGKYITVLDFGVGRVFQYENLEHFEDGWNGNDNYDSENIEWYLGVIKGHRLKDCSWMVHGDRRIIVQTPHGAIKQLQRDYDILGDDITN